LRNGPAFQYAFYLTFALTPLWLMTLESIKALRLKGDYSYGVYVYGWPIQQTLASLMPHAGVHINQFASIVISIGVAAISWHLVERPLISVGRRLSETLEHVFDSHSLRNTSTSGIRQ
jgi:peptidoglycan/LPS O-acetylase OafA/YrhL